MPRDNTLELTVSAKDQASKEIAKVGKAVDDFAKRQAEVSKTIQKHYKDQQKSFQNASNEIDKMAKSMKKAESSTGSMTKAIIQGGIALAGLQIGLQSINRFLQESVKVATDYQNSLRGTISLIRAFGLEEEKLTGSVKSLTQDGLLNQADAMKSIQNLLAGGLNIDQATELIKNYKDVAAFGRDITISFADAVKNNSEAFLTEMSVLGNRAGLQENFNQILKIGAQEMGKSVSQLNASERAQAKMIGTQLIAQRATGNTERLADSYTGALIRQQNAVNNLKIELGNALLPALAQLANMFTQGSSSGEALTKVIRGIGVVAIGVAGGVRILVTSLVDLIKIAGSMAASIKQSFQEGRLTFEKFTQESKRQSDEMAQIVESIGESVMDVWNGVSDNVGEMTKANNDYMTAMSDASKKALEDIAKEIKKYQRAVENLGKQFDENMRDLVVSHKEKVEKINQDMDEENDKYKEQLADRKKSFDKAMSDIEKRHSKKTESIKANILDEQEQFDDESKKIREKWDLVLSDLRKNSENRLSHLQSQLDKEVAKQSHASQERIKAIEGMIESERVALSRHMIVKEDMRDDEINEEQKELDDKLSDLKSQLDEENSEFKSAKDERVSEFQDETEKLKLEHQKRLNTFKEELQKELDLQREHNDVFEKFKDAIAESDIARLKRKHAEERVELERAHQERLQDIQRQVQAEQSTRDSGRASSTSPSSISSGASQAKAEEKTAAQKVSSLSPVMQSAVTSLSTTPVAVSSAQLSSSAKSSSGGGFISNVIQGATNIFNSIRKSLGFAEGGDFVVPGSGGRDSQFVGFRATPGEKVSISPSALQGKGGGVVINAPMTIVNSEMDITALTERLSWELNKQGII